jgi:hypothetical protein
MSMGAKIAPSPNKTAAGSQILSSVNHGHLSGVILAIFLVVRALEVVVLRVAMHQL